MVFIGYGECSIARTLVAFLVYDEYVRFSTDGALIVVFLCFFYDECIRYSINGTLVAFLVYNECAWMKDLRDFANFRDSSLSQNANILCCTYVAYNE